LKKSFLIAAAAILALLSAAAEDGVAAAGSKQGVSKVSTGNGQSPKVRTQKGLRNTCSASGKMRGTC